ncbi:hypothetical protein NM208_g14305 [Fusarium decemcellulare]|uniref:Uncharacterized protein n=1 Tax=Fusarium decemcellulare TaxID=57161 RepID=A0ACC1RGI9_9HYPO|nr:hypothetical protein NM208_g14305 [Fusarium decemcellulare]
MASYSPAPTLPSTCFENIKPQPTDMGLPQDTMFQNITPPESPIEAFLPKPETPKESIVFMPPTSNFIQVGHSVYPLSQVQMMALSLREARNNGEFPATTASAMDADAIVADYQALTQLRQLRGDFSAPVSEAYRQFQVEIARRITERDASLEEQTKQGEAARRVNTYLRAVAQEQQLFHASNTILQRRGIYNPTQQDRASANDEICTIVEQSIEQGIADATGPLRMNIGKLNSQSHMMSQQLELQKTALAALQTMFEPQASNIRETAQTLSLSHGIANHLSQLATELPGAINKAVQAAVQQQTQASFANILTAQQQAILDIEHRTRQLNALQHEMEAQVLYRNQERKRQGREFGSNGNLPRGRPKLRKRLLKTLGFKK